MALTFDQFVKQAGGTPKQVRVVQPASTPSSTPSSPGFLSRVSTDLTNRGANVRAEVTNPNQNPLVSGFKAAAQAAGGISDVVGEAAKSIAPNLSKSVSDSIGKGASAVIDYATPVGKHLLNLEQTHPEAAKAITNFLEIGAASGDIAGNILLAGGVPASISKVSSLASKIPTQATGDLLKTAGEKTTGLVTKMEEPTKISLQSYQANQPSLFGRIQNLLTRTKVDEVGTKPITEANTSVRLLNPGTEWQVGVDAKRVASRLWDNTLEPALAASKNVNNMKAFVDNLRSRILAETPDLDRRNALMKALDSFSEDYKHVTNFTDAKLQQYKEGWAKFLPDKLYKGEPIAAAAKQVRAFAADEARKVLYNILPEGAAKQAYIDYGNLQSIAEAGIKSVEGLTDKSFTRKVYEAVIDKAVTPIATLLGKVLYRTGEGLEFIGEPGAKKVRDIVSPAIVTPSLINANKPK